MRLTPSYLGLLRQNADFRRLWLGVVVSFFGDWFSTIALYAIAQELSDSATAISSVLIAKTLPMFLVTPFAGPLIDNYDRRQILLATDLARAVLVLGLIAGYLAGSLPVVIGVLTLQVACSGVFVPARTSVIPQITSDRELPVAMALSGGTWSVMLALGAAAGGLVTAWLGIVGALVVDAVTFLVSAAFIWGLPSLPARERGTGSASFLDGLAYLRGRVFLPALLLCKSGLALSAAALVTLPLFGNGVFPATAGPAFIGLLFAARGLGALLGSVGMRKLVGDDDHRLARMLLPAFLWTGVWTALVAWAPSIGWAALGYLAAAIGNGTIWVFSGIIAQRRIERAYRGRLFSLEFGVMTLISAGSSWLAGIAMDGHGLTPQHVNLIAGAVLLVPTVAWGGVLWLDPPSRSREARVKEPATPPMPRPWTTPR